MNIMLNFRALSFLFITAIIFSHAAVTAQIFEPVKWTFASKIIDEKSAELVFTAKIDKGWHVYSQFLGRDDGPIATTFEFEKSAAYSRDGLVTEGKPIEEFDPNFDMVLKYFGNTAVFRQKIKINATKPFVVKGFVDFMVCDESKCLPPEAVDFEIAVSPTTDKSDVIAPLPKEDKPAEDPVGQAAPEDDIFGLNKMGSKPEIYDPVKWTMKAEKISEAEYDVIFTARIEKLWHVYSAFLKDDGPLPTEITFKETAEYQLVGALKEGEYISKYDPNFDMTLNYFENEAVFTQRVKVVGGTPGIIAGEVNFMACDASKCLLPDAVPFEVNLETLVGTNLIDGEKGVAPSEAGKYLLTAVDLKNPVNNCGLKPVEQDAGLWSIFILGFLGGLLALITPCVFPMIPLTVSFFTKGSKDKKKGLGRAVTYGAFIFLIYILLSIPFHLMDSINPEILNEISTNVTLNVIFFIIFIVFAISFFGYFELTLPSSLANRIDSASNVGGLIGIFFMALTLAIVSFSCTGPILGSLLAGSLSSDGGAMQLTFGMGGFGLALALPFALFALFPNLLSALPRSGGWLTTVKVVLGFLEVALAVKFLSNADLVAHWGILKIELFLGLWIATGIGLVLYILGKIRFPHDSPVKKITGMRWFLAAGTLAFVGYLGSGFRYNESSSTFTSLTLLSGLAPPAGYSWMYPSKCPLSLNCYKDYEEALAVAQKLKKPLFIDFTGWACVNCRKMEENVWVDPEIFQRLNEDYVVVSLYVDDKKPLPEDQQESYVTIDGRKKKIRTVGNKWSTLQTETFMNNSQPYYVLLSPEEELLTTPVGYTPEAEEYRNFLDCGLDAMRNLNQSASLR